MDKFTTRWYDREGALPQDFPVKRGISVKKYRIVVKVGTSTLTRETGALHLANLDHLTRVLADLRNMGHQVILVSSGAIAVGAGKLGLRERPRELAHKQAAAAVGQCELMHLYDKFFGEYHHTVAQILLTAEDVADAGRAAHLSQTFQALMDMGVIPIVNENDSVSSAEIETGQAKVLGDNDTLSAIVAGLTKADLLVLLSDIDGLFDADPHQNPDAHLIPVVENVEAVLGYGGGAGSRWGTGGMCTKLSAAQTATSQGVDMVITHGSHPERLYDIVDGKPVGTRFLARK